MRPADQPRLPGRRFLLHPLGFRHRLRLRRPLDEDDGRGVPQTAFHPPAPDGRHRRFDRCRDVLFPGMLRLGCIYGVGRGVAPRHADERSADSGDPRDRNPGRRGDVPAERPQLVAVLRIHRQHPLCLLHPAASDPCARRSGPADRLRTGGIRRLGTARRFVRGVCADGGEHPRRFPASAVRIPGRSAAGTDIQTRKG